MRRRALELIPALILIIIPFSVQAGVFSGLTQLWEKPTTVDTFELTIRTPHEAGVLSAAQHSDPQAAIGGGDVIVDAGSLISAGTVGEDDIEAAHTGNEISVYTVRPGDTASQIAQMYGVSVNTIYWANDIKNGVIQPGDTLVILPINGVRHVVKDGETISSIAKKYSGDTEEILSYNQLASANDISVGDTVVIPNGEVASAPTRATATAQPTSVSGSASTGGGFSHPVPGAVRTQGLHGHNAIDFGAPVGTPIRAAAAGEVIVSKSSGWNGGYGNYIVVRHSNGTQTLYAHNSSNAVGVGAYVSAGQTIAYIGNTGRSTGPHLHFEVRGAVNPF